jgi:hypothetical protein
MRFCAVPFRACDQYFPVVEQYKEEEEEFI